jgi:hypothetical protein
VRGIVFGKTLDIAGQQLCKILEDYRLYYQIKIEEIVPNTTVVKLTNGDIWSCYEYNASNTCGRRANVVYIDSSIQEEEAKLNMQLTACAPPFQAIKYYCGQE